MKKKLLFVDDEPLVLQGLQRLMRPLRQEFEMDFAAGGKAACEHLLKAYYDVVITDMMMPDIDGSQVLAFAKEAAPKAIRIVLSGRAEEQLVMKCIGLAHQYLSKPCDPSVLKSVVERVTDPRLALRNSRVRAIVTELAYLPSLPTIYTRITELLNDPEASVEDVGKVIAGDMAMTAKLLQIVNSSFFGLPRRVSEPAEAASYLGLGTLKSLVLASNVFGQFETCVAAGFSPAAAAIHSQHVGMAARAIARCENAPRDVTEDALVAGMLHDVGQLVLASSLPAQFQHLVSIGKCEDHEIEYAVFGATHAEVGGYLLGLWGLPPPVVEAIAYHHRPSDSPAQSFNALSAVHVADTLINHGIPASADLQSTETGLDLEYLNRIGLAHRLPAWRDAIAELAAVPVC